MKKTKKWFFYAAFLTLLAILGTSVSFVVGGWRRQFLAIGVVWFAIISIGIVAFLLLRKGKDNVKKFVSKFLVAGTVVFFCTFLVYCSLFAVVLNYRYNGDFKISTDLFKNQKIMIIIPHQDDDINIAGGLIEQYIEGGSEVNVVFSTNGDVPNVGEIRAAETVDVLTQLGVNKDNIYYLGFGNYWDPQIQQGTEIKHIYNSIAGDAVWTSQYGATTTYDTKSIPCYLDLPYTRNNYLYSIEQLIQEIMPDVIFAVDFDLHIEHRGTSLLFEEAMCNVLKSNPQYHPTVYKGFCYGTAWMAPDDFYDSTNLLSTQKPFPDIWETASFCYEWQERVRFPISEANLNYILSKNSVYQSLDDYTSQNAFRNASSILNGDKVFWERRTDSLIYNAEILIGDKKTTMLNDFKITDFDDISTTPCINVGFDVLKDQVVRINTRETLTANCVYLYDNPDEKQNIIEGFITFSDGSKVDFGELNQNGSATKINFPSKEFEWLEITVTKFKGENFGLSEVELYNDTSNTQKDSCLMAVDSDDNLVYDYIISDENTANFQIRDLQNFKTLGEKDLHIEFESSNSSYNWEGDILVVKCSKDDKCQITVCAYDMQTSFSVENPSLFKRSYLKTLRLIDQSNYNLKRFLNQICSIIEKD